MLVPLVLHVVLFMLVEGSSNDALDSGAIRLNVRRDVVIKGLLVPYDPRLMLLRSDQVGSGDRSSHTPSLCIVTEINSFDSDRAKKIVFFPAVLSTETVIRQGPLQKRLLGNESVPSIFVIAIAKYLPRSVGSVLAPDLDIVVPVQRGKKSLHALPSCLHVSEHPCSLVHDMSFGVMLSQGRHIEVIADVNDTVRPLVQDVVPKRTKMRHRNALFNLRIRNDYDPHTSSMSGLRSQKCSQDSFSASYGVIVKYDWYSSWDCAIAR